MIGTYQRLVHKENLQLNMASILLKLIRVVGFDTEVRLCIVISSNE